MDSEHGEHVVADEERGGLAYVAGARRRILPQSHSAPHRGSQHRQLRHI